MPEMTIFDASMIADGEWDLTDFEESEDNLIAAYQLLVTTGVAWQLQGRVGREAMALARAGVIVIPERD